MKYSIILSTRRSFDDIKPLLLVSNKTAELIIIDSLYNEETKQQLKNTPHEFCQITYASSMREKIYKRDFLMGLNTGLIYAEGSWIIKIDDCTEFKPDFFDVINDAVLKLAGYYGHMRFVIRPVKLEGWLGDKKWDKYRFLESVKERFIRLDREGLGHSAFTTLDQLICSRETFDFINGYDERYDMGHGYDDNDIMQRLITAKYEVVMDQSLMTYQYEHKVINDYVDYNKILYQYTLAEVINGKILAYNPYDIKSMREKMLEKKKEYII